MAKHLMVDLETLAVSPRATILSLGAVTFDPFSDKIYNELYFRIDLDDQDSLQREIDNNTIDWWSKQDPKIMEEAFNTKDRVPFKEAMDKFHKFAWGCDAFWSHGSCFDIIILEDAFRQIKKTTPWKFWQIRDTRTIFDLGHDPEMPDDSKHDALADAKRQAIGVQNCYRKLKVIKK